MSELEYGIVQRARSAYRRTSPNMPPSARTIWHDAYPVLRPVEDWVEENSFVVPDAEIVKAGERKLAEAIGKTLSVSAPKNKIIIDEATRALKRKAAQEKAKATRERKKQQEIERKRQIEIDKPQKLFEFGNRLMHLIYDAATSSNVTRNAFIECIKMHVAVYKQYLDDIPGATMKTPIGTVDVKWTWEDRNFYPTLWFTTTP